MCSLGHPRISEKKDSSSRSWTGHHSTTQSYGDPHTQDSWQCHITRICYGEFRDPRAQSLCTAVSPCPTSATDTSTRFLNPSECKQSTRRQSTRHTTTCYPME